MAHPFLALGAILYSHPYLWLMWPGKQKLPQDAGLDKSQAGIKIARINIGNLRYADGTALMAESKEGLKSPLDEDQRGEWRSWLKIQHSKNEDHGTQSHHFMANRWGNSERFYFGTCSKITADVDCSHEIKKHFLLGRKAMINLVLVIQSCLTLCSPTDYSLWGSSVHGIFQTKILEWVAISFSRVNLNSPLKSRDITWPTKVHLVKAMVFPIVMYGWVGP